MSCSIPKEKLTAYLDKNMLPEDLKEMGKHVEICAECRTELNNMEKVKSLFKKVKNIERTPGYWDSLYLKIQDTLDRSAEKILIFTRKQFELFLGMAFIILFVLLFLWKNPIDRITEDSITKNVETGTELELLLEEHSLSGESGIIPEFANVSHIPKGKKEK
ncbi:anti-sigma factor family protein [candidate division KSB1 bacterium]